ncbi:hypothetical protein PoB_002824600 [Plakobranchus ocellatus]|uniref:Uncharacterized protein n=1 Tax=Plakobranchus ocellatus TaxID=259542 RepID=A0AAV4A524_9GAST|nr:hypothetical protein PoB_002824600 [Plakobranchus ocellatus]
MVPSELHKHGHRRKERDSKPVSNEILGSHMRDARQKARKRLLEGSSWLLDTCIVKSPIKVTMGLASSSRVDILGHAVRFRGGKA